MPAQQGRTFLWQYSTPSTTCRNNFRAVNSSRGPARRSFSSREPPEAYACTITSSFSVENTCKHWHACIILDKARRLHMFRADNVMLGTCQRLRSLHLESCLQSASRTETASFFIVLLGRQRKCICARCTPKLLAQPNIQGIGRPDLSKANDVGMYQALMKNDLTLNGFELAISLLQVAFVICIPWYAFGCYKLLCCLVFEQPECCLIILTQHSLGCVPIAANSNVVLRCC